VRKYDLSITYDYFHQTPRMWFVGYSNDGRLLTQQELLEDVMAEYANKTVTFEDHPKQNITQLSIHPCNHAKAMKKMIDTMIENGGKPRVEFSLFVFLKFISSVTPTIEYDNTVDLELD
jgi:ubiquitin-like-conjugating enzyme ATG3